MDKIEILKSLVREVAYPFYDNLTKEAEEYAQNNNMLIIATHSDDLCFVYGADCFLSKQEELLTNCWRGTNFPEEGGEQKEALQLGLLIYWKGTVFEEDVKMSNYDRDSHGCFFIECSNKINHRHFKVVRDKEVYGTGIILELPNDFKRGF